MTSGHQETAVGGVFRSGELRAMAEATGDVAWEFDVERRRFWRSVTWQTMLGHAVEPEEPSEEWTSLIHPEDLPAVAENFERWLRGGSARWCAEYRIARADGTYAHVLSRAYATRAADGRATRVIGTLVDMTRWRETEARLKERERQLAEAQEVARIGSWDFRVTTGTMNWSPELYHIYGVPPDFDTRFEHALVRLVPLEDQARVRQALEDIINHGTGAAHWRVVRPSDGQMRHIWGRGHLVLERGHPVRVVGIVQDVTEQELARAELAEARRVSAAQERLSTLGTLLAGVAHEINNPLSYIRGNGEMCHVVLDELMTRPDVAAELRDELKVMRGQLASLLKGVEQIAHVTSSLKQVARSGAQNTRRATPLNQVVVNALALASASLPMGIDVQTRLDHDGMVSANASELAQVVLNLVLNAGEALRHQGAGRISVRTYGCQGRAIVEVEDDGPGMAADVQAKLFTPFFTTKSEGTGLGLSVSRRIVQDHDGELRYETRLGHGSRFLIDLPENPMAES